MTQSQTEHSLYVQTLRDKWRWKSLTSIPSTGLSLQEAYTYFFGKLSIGDLCHFTCDSSPSIVGMISDMRYVITSSHQKIHLWSTVLVGDQEYIFHTRIDSHEFNDALLYTKSQAVSVLKIQVLSGL